ncbi:hypothetical protein L7F22_001482 [Adiantum nelumboides]|nr:hypothetical protein [Adiantum nelumboides]
MNFICLLLGGITTIAAGKSPLQDDVGGVAQEIDIDEDVSSDEEIDASMYVGHHDDLSDALRVGDNFAVNNEEEDSDFYILRCCTEKRLSTTTQKDAWCNQIKKNSYYVEGYFYDKVEGRSNRYVLLDDMPSASMYSHLDQCLKFPLYLERNELNVYTLSHTVYECIYNSMPFDTKPI